MYRHVIGQAGWSGRLVLFCPMIGQPSWSCPVPEHVVGQAGQEGLELGAPGGHEQGRVDAGQRGCGHLGGVEQSLVVGKG